MAPPPGLHGKGFISAVPPLDDSWSGRLQRLQGGDNTIDPRMDALKPPAPDIDRYMESPLADNLPQMPGYPMEGWLPINATQGAPNPNDPRYLQWMRLTRQRAGI
jgi:hypothetical protein